MRVPSSIVGFMLGSSRLPSIFLASTLMVALASACGSDDTNSVFDGSPDQGTGVDATFEANAPETSFGFETGAQDGTTDSSVGLDVEPSTLQTLTVPLGQQTPTVQYAATYDLQPVSAGWGVDRGDLATVGAGPSTTTVVAPTGTTGGLVTLTAGLNNQTV